MGLEELKEAGVLLPEEEWGEHEVKTTVRQFPMLIASLSAVAGWILAYIGGGDTLTWIGIIVFLITFFAVLYMCDRAVTRQRKRFKEERKEMEADK